MKEQQKKELDDLKKKKNARLDEMAAEEKELHRLLAERHEIAELGHICDFLSDLLCSLCSYFNNFVYLIFV